MPVSGRRMRCAFVVAGFVVVVVVVGVVTAWAVVVALPVAGVAFG